MAGMVVKNNMSALNTLNMLNTNHSQLSKSLAKVSSGMRINGAADDASGYAISERMRVQIRGLEQDNRNTQNGNSLLKVAEGAVSSTVDILKTLKEKVINAANDTNTDEDRATIQKELDQSIDQINDNANVTYNGKYLVDGTKNSQGSATYTALTNKSLSTSTTRGTTLTALQNRNDESLGILSTDKVTVSYVQQGKTYTTTFSVGANSLQSIFVKAEAIDGTTSTFANNTNLSAATAELYPTVPTTASLAAREAALRQARDDALADWNTAQTTYNTAVSNYNTAKSATDTAVSTWRTNLLSVPDGSSAGQWGYYCSVADNVSASTVSQSMSTLFQNTDYPDPTTVQDVTGTPSTATEILGRANAKANTWSSSVTAFGNANTAWNTYSGTGLGSYTDYQNKKTALATATSDLAAKEAAYIQAQNDYDAEFGPYIIDTEYLGLDKNGNLLATSDREKAITVTAYGSGIDGQIAGFTISVSDNQGNIKKDVNAALDAWTETIRAENESKNDNSIVLQTGTKANQAIKVALTDMRSEALGLKGSDGQTLNIGTQKKANAAISVLDNAIQKALDEQTKIGSIQSRLEYTSANLTTATENVQASESAIRDADMAKEMTEYTKNNVLLQTSQSMLAQANQSSSNVLGLLA